MNTKLLRAALICSMMVPLGFAHAADVTSEETELSPNYPFIEGEFVWEIEGDHTFSADDPDAEITDIYGAIELVLAVHMNETFQFNLGIVGEAVQDPTPGQNRFFDDHGLYISDLNVQFNLSEETSLVAGKFGPSFGTAWDVTPGIYGTGFAEDYELSEMIGFGLSHTFDAGDAGSVTLGANVFFADTTFLSDSIITSRGRTNLADGGAGNTEELDNFSITLDGEELPSIEGLAWHLGYRHLSAGQGDVSDEQGFVAGLTKETAIGDDQSVVLNFEYATFSNFGGGADDNSYLTAGLSFVDGPWHLDFAGTLRRIDLAAGGETNDELFQASIGYVDENEIDWNLGYQFSEDGGQDSHTFGVFITKAVEFSNQ